MLSAMRLNEVGLGLRMRAPEHKDSGCLSFGDRLNNGIGDHLPTKLGYSHIPQRHAELMNVFHREHFNPYLNYHRACHFPLEVVDNKGKVRKTYLQDRMQTPFEKLISLPATSFRCIYILERTVKTLAP
jgi:hypothetical protein